MRQAGKQKVGRKGRKKTSGKKKVEGRREKKAEGADRKSCGEGRENPRAARGSEQKSGKKTARGKGRAENGKKTARGGSRARREQNCQRRPSRLHSSKALAITLSMS